MIARASGGGRRDRRTSSITPTATACSPAGLGFHYGAERIGAAVIPVSGGNTQRQVQIMQDFGSTVLCCTPSYALLIAEAAAEEGIDLARCRSGRPFRCRAVVRAMRAGDRGAVRDASVRHYGLSELIGPGVAERMRAQAGAAHQRGSFHPEIVDPESGERLPDGEIGELVSPGHERGAAAAALPYARSNTADPRAVRLPAHHSPYAQVLGRTDDMIIVRGVNVFPSQIETVLLEFGEVEPHYQIVVDRGRDLLDELDVLVEASAEVFQSQERLSQLEQRLGYGMQSALGIICKVRLVAPKQIQRSEGKAVRVVDKRQMA